MFSMAGGFARLAVQVSVLRLNLAATATWAGSRVSTAPRYQVRYRIFRPAVAPALDLFEDQRAFAFAQNQFSFETDDLVESPEGKKDKTSINISITIYSWLWS